MASNEPSKNVYLDQVMEQQQVLQENLRARKLARPMAQAARGPAQAMAFAEPQVASAVEVRITGFWRWKTVVVPPNAYVVHTRRGKADPVTLGLGVSFRYNPYTDAFLVVPGAMQTILINAQCICKERQGLLVQGYVQWIVQDFATAYRKLDFSDVEDPMRLVNLQLKEQAEAAIKDKVATMGIDDVLSDKQPIIEELTARLRSVAEGVGGSDKGLGLRIVTVQIKEAVVSSQRLWDNLQKPFRAERAQVARLAEIQSEEAITARELDQRRRAETGTIEAERELSAKRAQSEAEVFDRDQSERLRRSQTEQQNARALAQAQTETAVKGAALAKTRLSAEAEVERQKSDAAAALAKAQLEAKLGNDVARAQADLKLAELAAAGAEARQKVENGLTDAGLKARVIAALPQVVEKLPKPAELKSVSIGGAGEASVAAAVAQVSAVLQAMKGLGDGAVTAPPAKK